MTFQASADQKQRSVPTPVKSIFLAGNFLSEKTGVTSPCEELAQQFSSRDFQVISSSSCRNRVLRMADLLWTAFRYRKRYKVALLEVYSFLAFRWAELLSFLLRRLGKPYILSLHGGMLPEFAAKHPRRFKSLIKSADVVTSPSKIFCDQFSEIRNDIKYVPNGINLAHYPIKLRMKPEPKFCWMHSIHSVYNPTLAIRVFRKIIEKYPTASLQLIGPNNNEGLQAYLKALLDDLQLSDQVKIIGAIPKADVGSYLSEGDIFLNTTNYESFGVSTLEAAACALCIVTTDAGELPFLWEDGVDALIVPKNNADAMSDSVLRILDEPALARKLSANARKKAEDHDWSMIMPQWELIYSNIVNAYNNL